MRMKKNTLPFLFIAFLGFILPTLQAQYHLEALRFTRNTLQGTTRFVSMGGAMGALGADYSVISSNPAGLGVFRNSQFTLSPGLHFANSVSNYAGTEVGDERFQFQFGNVGAVFHKNMEDNDSRSLKGFNFSLGYNRVNSFNRSILISGDNETNSLGSLFADRANGRLPNSLDSYTEFLGFNTYLIDTLPGQGGLSYGTLGLFADEVKRVSRQVTSKGSVGEINLALAGNFQHRLYVGASLGIVRMDFEDQSVYGEYDLYSIVPNFNEVLFRETLSVQGTGVNLKVGAIYRISDLIRIGLAIHTPTWMAMNETYKTAMTTRFVSQEFNAESPTGAFDYDLTQPWRCVASLGIVLDKDAMIGAEYEWVNYANMRLRADALPTFGIMYNSLIDSTFRHAHQFRLGGEYRWDPWRVRAGFSFLGNPFRALEDLDRSIYTYSFGLGYRTKRWIWFDAAYVLQQSEGNMGVFNDFNELNPARLKLNHHLISFTIGFIF